MGASCFSVGRGWWGAMGGWPIFFAAFQAYGGGFSQHPWGETKRKTSICLKGKLLLFVWDVSRETALEVGEEQHLPGCFLRKIIFPSGSQLAVEQVTSHLPFAFSSVGFLDTYHIGT